MLDVGQLVSLNLLCAGRHMKVPLGTKEERLHSTASLLGLLSPERELFMVCYKSAAASRIDRDCYVRLLVRACCLFILLFSGDAAGFAEGSVAGHFCSVGCSRIIFGNQGIWSHDSFHSVRPDG